MKKLFLLSVILTLLSFKGFAQYYEEPAPPPRHSGTQLNKIRFGVFLAPNVSWMKPTSSRSNDGDYRISAEGTKVGFTWGLMAEYYFTENYAFATGFQLNNTGGNILARRRGEPDSSVSFVSSADFTYRLQYLEVPLNLKFRSDDLMGKGLKVFGQVGLTPGINIGKKANYDVTYWDAQDGDLETVSENKEKLYGSFTIAPVMLQLNIGGGFERALTEKMSFYMGVFFNNGFAPDATKPEEFELEYKGQFSDGNIRLNNIAFRFGIFF